MIKMVLIATRCVRFTESELCCIDKKRTVIILTEKGNLNDQKYFQHP